MIQCPKCGVYLSEKEMLKTSVKYAPGNVAIEYDAQCPRCQTEIGKVSWGQLTVNPQLQKEIAAAENKKTTEVAADAEVTPPAGKLCPHCGKPLPADF